ncbi:MAG: T9SS type A sorting domain-containing protein [Prevotellaceae bacterium]|jgi:hypothetical protein|nr:T9SS type A sorting domain-containing protein [Prevotellaceae bacterium]
MKKFLPLMFALAISILAFGQKSGADFKSEQAKKGDFLSSVFNKKTQNSSAIAEDFRSLKNFGKIAKQQRVPRPQRAPAAVQDIVYTPITLPYDETLNFSEETTQPFWGNIYYGYAFSFTMAADDYVTFSSDQDVYFSLFTDEAGYDYVFEGAKNVSGFLEAGTYYLWIDEDGIPMPFLANVKIETVTVTLYQQLDYSDNVLNNTIYGDENNLVPTPLLGSDFFYCAAYHFAAQAERFYKVTVDAYLSEPDYDAVCILLKDELTGILGDDMLSMDHNYSNSHFLYSLNFKAEESGDVKILFGLLQEQTSVYSVLVEEIPFYPDEPTENTFSYVDITLPYSAELHFDPAYNTLDLDLTAFGGGTIYAKGLKLVLTTETTIGFYNNYYSYLFVFTTPVTSLEELMVNIPVVVMGGDILSLPAGTYYLLLVDNGYYQDNQEYLTETIMLEKIENDIIVGETISLSDLLNAPDITNVAYSALPYSDAGYFIEGYSAAVNGADGLFRESGYVYFAKAYKLTGMQAGNFAKIHVANSDDAYMYIYKKDAEGNIVLLVEDDDGWGSDLQSYLELTADAAVDYYVVATTYWDYDATNNSTYAVTIWTGETEPEPPTPPGLGEILSTSASVTQIYVGENATLLDVKLALKVLDITATKIDGTMVIENNPLAWIFYNENTEAKFENYDFGFYTLAATYVPATVTINYTSGIYSPNTSSLRLYPNPAVETVNISGLQGGEKISIIDLNGRIMHTQNITAQETSINVSSFAQGAYIIAVQNSGKMEVMKFVKK